MKNKKVNKSELEIRINDAADGLLNRQEIAELESDLQAHPELMMDYQSVMNLPDFSGIYGEVQEYQNRDRISAVLKKIESPEGRKSSMNFENITVLWFKRYAIAASFLILALTSVFSLSQQETIQEEVTFEELFYPQFDVTSDEYVTYLNDWIEP